jgi:hypothetical protein
MSNSKRESYASREGVNVTERHLRAEIRRLKEAHRLHLDAKDQEIEKLKHQRNAEVVTLFAQYPCLEDLLAVLVRIADYADPISSVAYDNDSVSVTADNLHDRPIEGRGTEADRRLQVDAGDEVKHLAARLKRWLEPKGPVAERLGARYHWARACPGRGLIQPWDTEDCRFCGEPIGTYEKPAWMEKLEEAANQ